MTADTGGRVGVAGEARIHEQGYRRYDGIRHGSNHAIRAVFLHTLRFILGLKRRMRAKIVPFGVIAVATLPALGFSAALMLLPDFASQVADELLPGPEIYMGGTVFLTYIAAAMAGPAALCGDRLHGSLAIYLASPLTRRTYLAGKAAAVMAFLSAVTIFPSLVYVLGMALSGTQDQSVQALSTDILQVVVAGAIVAAGYTVLSLAAASLTDRQGAASGIVVGVTIIGGTVAQVLVRALGMPDAFGAVDFSTLMTSAGLTVHGAEAALGTVTSLLGAALWIVALAALVVWRYERLEVTR